MRSTRRAVLYGSPNLTARWDVVFGADGFDQIGVEAVLAPRGFGHLEEFVVVAVGSVGPAVAAERVPEVFDAVEFRRVRRQRDERDVGRHLQVVSAMEAGSVPDQGRVNIGSQRA